MAVSQSKINYNTSCNSPWSLCSCSRIESSTRDICRADTFDFPANALNYFILKKKTVSNGVAIMFMSE